MNMSKRDRNAVMLGVAGLGLIALVKLAVMPVIHHWRDMRDDIDRYQTTLADIERNLDSFDFMRANLETGYGRSLAKPLTNVSTTLLDFDEVIQKVLSESGVAMQSMSHQGARQLREVPGVALVTIHVQAVGDLGALSKCLDRMRQAERLVLVDQLSVHKADRNKPDQLAYTMDLSTPALESPLP